MDKQKESHQFVFDCNGPTVMGFVGPNGSGKSSIVEALGIRGVEFGDPRFHGRIVVDCEAGETLVPIVNPDEIARAIKDANPSLTVSECNLMAFNAANQIRLIYADAGIDFAFETVGSHPSKVEFLEGLKSSGYFVAVLFVGTESSDINVRRVQQRVRLGGHDVERDKIVSRYERTMELLPRYFAVADYMAIYDNSVDAAIDTGEGPRLLLTKRNGSVNMTASGKESLWLARYLLDYI